MVTSSSSLAPAAGNAGSAGIRALGTVLALNNLSVVVIIDHGAGAI